MDLSNLLPDAGSSGCGYSADQFTEKFTATLSSCSDSYFLGYISPTEIPSVAFPYKLSYDNEAREITFHSVSKNNAAIGYVMKTNYEWSSWGFEQSNGDGVFKYQLSNFRYFNNFYPEFSSFGEKMRLGFRYAAYTVSGGGSTLDTFSQTFVSFDTYAQVDGFLNNGATATISINNNNYTFSFVDLVDGEGTVYLESEDDSTKYVRLFLTYVGFAGGSRYNGSNIAGGFAGLNIKTFGTFEDNTEGYLYTLGEFIGLPSMDRIAAYDATQDRIYVNNQYERMSGVFNDVVIDVDTLPQVAKGLLWDSGIISYNTTSTFTEFYTYITNPYSIKTIQGLCYRVNPGGVASYVENSSYATTVDGTDYAGNLKTGDINNSVFKGNLEHWQYVDLETYDPVENPQGVIENDFTVNDIPEFEPEPEPEPENPDDPDEAPVEEEPEAGPDKNDRGGHWQGPTDANYPANPSPFVKYGIFTYDDLLILSEQLWNKPDGFFESLAGAQKVNPMDYFISLRWYPFAMTGNTVSALYLGAGGGLTVNHAELSQLCFVLDWGAVKVKPFYKNFLDYDPYTKIYIYLPFCGQIELNSIVVMDKELSLSSAFDVAEGSLVWILWNETDSQPVLVKQCSIGCQIPLSGVDAAQMSANIVNATLGFVNSVSRTGVDVISRAKTGATAGAAAGLGGAIAGGAVGTIGGLASNATNLMGSFAAMGMASKEIPQLTGGSSGFGPSGLHEMPAIIYQRPLATNPSTYGKTVGYLCNKAKRIGDMSGYTVCKNTDTSGISHATEQEKAAIKQILDSGFFV